VSESLLLVPTASPATTGGERRRDPLRRLLGLTTAAWPQLGLAVLTGFGTLACGIGLLATAAWLISRAAEHPPVLELSVAVVAVRAFGLGRGALRYTERLVSHDAVFRVLTDVRVQVYQRLEPLAPGGLPSARSGDVLQRLLGDVDSVQDLLLRGVVPVLTGALTALVTVIFAAVLLPVDGLVLAVTLLLAGVLVPWLTARAGRDGALRVAPARGALAGEIVDTLGGAADLLVTGAVDDRLARVDALDGELTRAARSSASALGLGAALSSLGTGAAVLGALVVGIPAVHDGRLHSLLLAVLVLLPLAAFEAVQPLPAAVAQMMTARLAAARLFAVLDADLPVHEPVTAATLPTGRQDLQVHGAGVRYHRGQAWALRGVDLTVPAGSRVAVVGPSGSGKTTLLLALLRFVELDEGRLTYGGVDLAGCSGDDVRHRIGACLQDAHVFATTVRGNLRVARPDASDAELEDALRQARLLDWVRTLPAGLDTVVGQAGSAVSGGERQRLSLARALLADPDVLLLDEPTEGLDAEAEAELMADLLAATQGRTTIVVTHRLTGLQHVERIVVLQDGRISQQGGHDELIAVPGWYAAAWEQQQADRRS
jgi:thiol reductant ABC exporter CydC subunit